MNSLDELYKEMSAEPVEESAPKPRNVRKTHFSLEKTHSYIQEQIASSEPYLQWTNETLFKDRARLYALCFQYLKTHDEPSLISALRWATGKRVHVRALFKVLLK